jgi:2-(1,2-epoxy-1,2-dihydrophenyl)acetyl-CoA isomerase
MSMPGQPGQVTVEHADRVAWITLDRPAAKNALTSAMVSTLADAVDELSRDDAVEVVVLRGAGTDFCAGSDMGDIASALRAGPAERGASFERGIKGTIHPLTRALLDLPQPVVASARGHAIGIGVAFLLAADLVVASETARISMPQVRLGHTLDHGESYLLPRRIGPSKAMQLCLLGERMTGHSAERFGLANWLTADADLEARTDAVVADLLAVAPIPLARTKALLRASIDASITEQLQAEVDSARACAATEDFVEAVSAQIERRTPKYVRA